jgi:hypothetical protein
LHLTPKKNYPTESSLLGLVFMVGPPKSDFTLSLHPHLMIEKYI